MKRVLVLLLCAASCSPTTELQRKEQVIQGALDAAYVACTAGLGDPRIEWEAGARDYCLRIVNAESGCKP